MTDLFISEWKLLRLTVDQIGPFQEALNSISFRAAEEDALFGRQPANLYMILAKNGHGKTTLLECLHGLMGLLSAPKVGRFANPQSRGRAQADFQVRWTLDGTPHNLVFSIWTGARDPVIAPDDTMLRSVASDAAWGRLGLEETAAGEVIYDATDHHGRAFYQAMCAQRGAPPTGLFGDSQTLPTVLFFPADRRVVAPNRGHAIERPARWSYQPAQTFSSDGPEWADSIDNLLVWLDWLDDGRLPDLLRFTNDNIFGDGKALRAPKREELAAYVSAGGNQHPLAALSHGERALLQLYVRTACHMTRNTLVLIDEVELHLHSTWMLQMLQVLKSMLRDHPQLGIVFTTHDRELMKVFDHRRVESGLTKGGYLIEDADAGA